MDNDNKNILAEQYFYLQPFPRDFTPGEYLDDRPDIFSFCVCKHNLPFLISLGQPEFPIWLNTIILDSIQQY